MRQSKWLRSFILLVGLAALLTTPLWPQRGRDPWGGFRGPSFPSRATLTRMRVKASHERLQKEVAELAQMSAELQEQISKTTEDVLPLDALKKAEEIEKLAKKIQGRIKNL